MKVHAIWSFTKQMDLLYLLTEASHGLMVLWQAT